MSGEGVIGRHARRIADAIFEDPDHGEVLSGPEFRQKVLEYAWIRAKVLILRSYLDSAR